MIYLTAQPDRTKFYWQLRVQLENFKDIGIPMSSVHVLVGCDLGPPSRQMRSLAETGAQVFFYPYEKDYRYLSSVRPHIIKQHYKKFPQLVGEYVFYLDSDVIFQRLPKYEQMVFDGLWYVSDTRGYISSAYIMQQGGPEIFMDMCGIVGIDPFFVQSRDGQAGGCQYILHGVNHRFWEKVEQDCVSLFTSHPHYNPSSQQFEGHNAGKYNALKEKPIQIWCADMWSLLWNAWLAGKQTVVHPELSFCWGHHSLESFSQPMLHMAGVTEDTQKNEFAPHFNKAVYDQSIPFNDDFSHVNPNSATQAYIHYFNRFKDANVPN